MKWKTEIKIYIFLEEEFLNIENLLLKAKF